MKVNFTNLKRKIGHAYNRVVTEFVNGTGVRGTLEEAIEGLRPLIATLLSTYEDDEPDNQPVNIHLSSVMPIDFDDDEEEPQ